LVARGGSTFSVGAFPLLVFAIMAEIISLRLFVDGFAFGSFTEVVALESDIASSKWCCKYSCFQLTRDLVSLASSVCLFFSPFSLPLALFSGDSFSLRKRSSIFCCTLSNHPDENESGDGEEDVDEEKKADRLRGAPRPSPRDFLNTFLVNVAELPVLLNTCQFDLSR